MRGQKGENNNFYRHGLSQHSLFGRWYRMVKRCTDPNASQYADYGGRGITVCSEWLDPAAYIAYVENELGPQPGPGYSLDRTDNDRGYEPGNLRWATHSEQQANQRQRTLPGYPVGATGFKGVSFFKPKGTYRARVQVQGRQVFCRYFKTALEAAHAYDREAYRIHGKRARLNFGVPEAEA